MGPQALPNINSATDFSTSFSFDATYGNERSEQTTAFPVIDDDFDLSSFDAVLQDATLFGLQDHTEFEREDLELIGEGITFKVFRCRIHLRAEIGSPPSVVALKQLKVKLATGGPPPSIRQQDCLKAIFCEIFAMSALAGHPNILRIYGFGSEYDVLNRSYYDVSNRSGYYVLNKLPISDMFSYIPYLVVEYAPLGTLSDYLGIAGDVSKRKEQHKDQKVPLDTRIQLFLGVGRGIEALHKQNFIHRDIKPQNVLVFPDDQGSVIAKVADFGFTLYHGANEQHRLNVQQYFGGTERYTAPELIACPVSDLSIEQMRKGDMFSFGMTALECLTTCSYHAWDVSQKIWADDNIESLWSLQETSSRLRTTVEQLLSRTLCAVDDRISSLSQILAPYNENVAGAMIERTSDPTNKTVSILELTDLLMSEPTNLPILPNVFSKIDSSYLDGEHDLQASFGIAPRMTAMVKAMPVTRQRNVYQSLREVAETGPNYAKSLFRQGLCRALGLGASVDFGEAISLVYKAAQAGYRPARYSYRRLYQAFYSLSPDELIIGPLRANSLSEIDPRLNTILSEIEVTHSNEYLAYACHESEKEAWRERVLRSCPKEFPHFTESEIRSSSINETIRSLRNDISRFTREAIEDPNQPYPVDYLIALAIVFDDSEGNLSANVADSLGTILGDWNFHFSGFHAQISPLFLAARVGNACATRYLTSNGASSSYKSYLGMIPLHFLFMFDDHDIDQMALLLASDLIPSDPYIVSKTSIFEELCPLNGTPLAFSVQVNHLKSIQVLSALENSVRSRYNVKDEWPLDVYPGLTDPTAAWETDGKLFDQLAFLHLDTSIQGREDQINTIYARTASFGDLGLTMTLLAQAWTFRQVAHWICYGNVYQQRLQSMLQILFEAPLKLNQPEILERTYDGLQSFLILAPTCTNATILSAMAVQTRASVPAQYLYDELFSALDIRIEFVVLRRPRFETKIALFPSDSWTWGELVRGVILSYRCHDIKAFSRIFSRQATRHKPKLAVFALFIIAESPSEDMLIFIKALTRLCTTDELPLIQKYMAVRHTIWRGYADSLHAFYEVWGQPCLSRGDGTTIMHHLCAEDGYMDLLDGTITFLGNDVVGTLLSSQTFAGKLRPVDIAMISGSCGCMRILIRRYYDLADSVDLTHLDKALEIGPPRTITYMGYIYSERSFLSEFVYGYAGLRALDNPFGSGPCCVNWRVLYAVNKFQAAGCVARIRNSIDLPYSSSRSAFDHFLEISGFPGIDHITNSATAQINAKIDPETLVQFHIEVLRFSRGLTYVEQIYNSPAGRAIRSLSAIAVMYAGVRLYRRFF